jgi:hypothetical protein
MNTPEVNPGVFDIAVLPNAEPRRLQSFTTTSWAEMSELFVEVGGKTHVYPYIFDGLSGFLSQADQRHPLHGVSRAISGDLYSDDDSLTLLAFQVGQTVTPERTKPVKKWERDYIRDIEDQVAGEKPLLLPRGLRTGWKQPDMHSYYEQIRAAEAARLHGRVTELAGHIASQNETEQLFVVREKGLSKGSGWLAPLLGLAIDTKNTNDYNHQVHDVIPVVRQTDGAEALLRGANRDLYTARNPHAGNQGVVGR